MAPHLHHLLRHLLRHLLHHLPRPGHARTALLAATLAVGMTSATPATAATAAADPAAVLADLQAGRLLAAEAALRGWAAATPEDMARQRRLGALVQQQRQLAARLLARAEADLQQRRLPQAMERLEAALAVDDRLAQQPRAAALLAARSRLWQARDAVAHCLPQRNTACMDRALRQARALAPRDPALALLALQASAWWSPGQAGRPAPVDGTTGSR